MRSSSNLFGRLTSIMYDPSSSTETDQTNDRFEHRSHLGLVACLAIAAMSMKKSATKEGWLVISVCTKLANILARKSRNFFRILRARVRKNVSI